MEFDKSQYTFYDVTKPPFKVYGLSSFQQGNFRRMPQDIADTVNEGVSGMSCNSTGGRLRFKTNSSKIAICAEVAYHVPTAICNTLLTFGFDLYEEIDGMDVYRGSFRDDVTHSTSRVEREIILQFPKDKSEREITVNFPLFCKVKNVQIGVLNGATVEEHRPYRVEKPVVFYGSSITHGAAASRPGLCYEAVVSRRLDVNYVNLGFAGNAKAEDSMIDYICSLDMSAFVLDYDHNAPNLQHLIDTHLKAYKKVREAHPDIPIILTSKPDIHILDTDDNVRRRITVQKTYHYAIENGDQNVYYIDGYSLFEGTEREDCTVDGCHPNDIGFNRMAGAFTNTLRYAMFWK